MKPPISSTASPCLLPSNERHVSRTLVHFYFGVLVLLLMHLHSNHTRTRLHGITITSFPTISNKALAMTIHQTSTISTHNNIINKITSPYCLSSRDGDRNSEGSL